MTTIVDETYLREPNLWVPGKKPIGPVKVDWGHNLSDGMIICNTFQSSLDHNLAGRTPSTNVNGGTFGTDRYGKHLRLTRSADQYIKYGIDPLTTSTNTFAIIRRRIDATSLESVTFALDTGDNINRCQVHLPWAGGIVYFDYGGTVGGTTRASFTHNQNENYEMWVFRAGSLGMSIWLNGVKKASHATVAARTISSSYEFQLNYQDASMRGMEQRFYLFIASNSEWSDAQVMEWFKDPYQFLIP